MVRLRSVRARAALGACLIMTVFIVAFAAVFLSLLRRTLVDEVDESAEELVEDLALEATQGLLPDLSEAPVESANFVQIVDDNGRVIENTANLAGARPLARTAPSQLRVRTVPSPLAGDDARFRLAALSATTGDGPVAVFVGRTLRNVEHDIVVAQTILGVGLPLLVALVGSTTWVLVGRALRPVDAIRAEVAEISASDLHHRVPQPSTGDEIARLAVTMNGMLDRLEEASDRQRRFVSDASHELRSPLAVLRVELEVALQSSRTPDWPALAGRLLGDVTRQERLVDDLLYLARAEAQPTSRLPALVDLDEVVLDEVRRARTRSPVPVDTSAVSAAPVRGHREDLGRVVSNLLDNAVRHAGTAVNVSLGVSGADAVLAVVDDGPGIPPELRDRIFDRFARLDEGRSRDQGGSGLGLAIAREVVEAHGGTLTVDSSQPGARLVVRLPAEA